MAAIVVRSSTLALVFGCAAVPQKRKHLILDLLGLMLAQADGWQAAPQDRDAQISLCPRCYGGAHPRNLRLQPGQPSWSGHGFAPAELAAARPDLGCCEAGWVACLVVNWEEDLVVYLAEHSVAPPAPSRGRGQEQAQKEVVPRASFGSKESAWGQSLQVTRLPPSSTCLSCWQGCSVAPLQVVGPLHPSPREEAQAWQDSWVLPTAPSSLEHLLQVHRWVLTSEEQKCLGLACLGVAKLGQVTKAFLPSGLRAVWELLELSQGLVAVER